jgi:hypothetical protein
MQFILAIYAVASKGFAAIVYHAPVFQIYKTKIQ